MNKKIFVKVAILLFSTPAVATKAPPFNIQFECGKIHQELMAFKSWTESRSLKCELPKQMEETKAGMCTADVSTCIPHHVLAYHGKNPAVNGPNCFNLALVIAGVLPSLRYSTGEEMAFFYGSPLCRVLTSNEKKQPGDLGVIVTAPRGDVLHAFIRISDNLVYSKNGYSKEQAYFAQHYEPMSKLYQEMQKNECVKNKYADCETVEQTIRCISMDSYLNDPNRAMPRSIKEAFIRLDHSENCLSINTVHNSALNWPQKKSFLDSIKVIANYFDSAEFKADLKRLPEAEGKFINGSLSIRLEAMLAQLQHSKEDGFLPCLTCHLLSDGTRKAAEKLKTK